MPDTGIDLFYRLPTSCPPFALNERKGTGETFCRSFEGSLLVTQQLFR
jgi:hypothetical protein